jgi:hypothetical protein
MSKKTLWVLALLFWGLAAWVEFGLPKRDEEIAATKPAQAAEMTAPEQIAPTTQNDEKTEDLTMAISLMLRDPNDATHGVAMLNDEAPRYSRSITVNFTGRAGDTVEKQVKTTAETALRIGHLALDRAIKPPGTDLIIKMALRKPDGWFINTFSVRYHWQDVLDAAKAQVRIANLAAKGKIETIWLEYWPEMCLNQPPKELFAGGNGDPEEPEDIENPKRKDLSCHRRR